MPRKKVVADSATGTNKSKAQLSIQIERQMVAAIVRALDNPSTREAVRDALEPGYRARFARAIAQPLARMAAQLVDEQRQATIDFLTNSSPSNGKRPSTS